MSVAFQWHLWMVWIFGELCILLSSQYWDMNESVIYLKAGCSLIFKARTSKQVFTTLTEEEHDVLTQQWQLVMSGLSELLKDLNNPLTIGIKMNIPAPFVLHTWIIPQIMQHVKERCAFTILRDLWKIICTKKMWKNVKVKLLSDLFSYIKIMTFDLTRLRN